MHEIVIIANLGVHKFVFEFESGTCKVRAREIVVCANFPQGIPMHLAWPQVLPDGQGGSRELALSKTAPLSNTDAHDGCRGRRHSRVGRIVVW